MTLKNERYKDQKHERKIDERCEHIFHKKDTEWLLNIEK